MQGTRYQEAIYRARLSEKAERFDQMVQNMKEAVETMAAEGVMIGLEERNLLSVAYKNQVGARRTSWRILAKILHDEQIEQGGADGAGKLAIINEYIVMVESELNSICDDLLQLLERYLLVERADEPEDSRVFFLKMKGDYLRYKAEIAKEATIGKISEEAHTAYQTALDIATSSLSKTNPTRLGLALNYSVFCFEILNQKSMAVDMGKQAFDGAISELDSLSEESYKDSTLIMQLLRDNLSLWTTEYAEDMKNEEEAGR